MFPILCLIIRRRNLFSGVRFLRPQLETVCPKGARSAFGILPSISIKAYPTKITIILCLIKFLLKILHDFKLFLICLSKAALLSKRYALSLNWLWFMKLIFISWLVLIVLEEIWFKWLDTYLEIISWFWIGLEIIGIVVLNHGNLRFLYHLIHFLILVQLIMVLHVTLHLTIA